MKRTVGLLILSAQILSAQILSALMLAALMLAAPGSVHADEKGATTMDDMVVTAGRIRKRAGTSPTT